MEFSSRKPPLQTFKALLAIPLLPIEASMLLRQEMKQQGPIWQAISMAKGWEHTQS